MNQLFFEFIRLSIGVSDSLSWQPSADEWGVLFQMAVKQSLLGVCFAGVTQLVNSKEGGFARMPIHLYYQWLGCASKIHARNEVMNQQCIELQSRLAKDGFRSCILKGQGAACNYGPLADLRQSGDIDVWIYGGLQAALNLLEHYGEEIDVTEQHVHLHLFEETDVEAHFRPSYLMNPFANRRLQRWFEEQSALQFEHKNKLGMVVPTNEFNRVYMLIHIYRHLFSDGVGLRQVMDYYFMLSASSTSLGPKDNLLRTLERFGLSQFAGGLMWVLGEVFGLERESMICKPDEWHGRFLLGEIMLSGNMGHYDERLKAAQRHTRWQRFMLQNKHNLRLLRFYPAETLCDPISRFYIWTWRKWNRWI